MTIMRLITIKKNRLTALIYLYIYIYAVHMHISQVRKSALFIKRFVQHRYNVNRNAKG